MTSFDRSPDELQKLRGDVSSWLDRGLNALKSCQDEDDPGFFVSNSKESRAEARRQDRRRHDMTTTSRAYAALMRVDQTMTPTELREATSDGPSEELAWFQDLNVDK